MVDPHPKDPGRATFRRILVALDASQESMDALSTAAQMARRLHAELIGLFVEDENLLKLVQHPFAREVNLLTSVGRSLDTATLERDLKMQAALARRGLERVAADAPGRLGAHGQGAGVGRHGADRGGDGAAGEARVWDADRLLRAA